MLRNNFLLRERPILPSDGECIPGEREGVPDDPLDRGSSLLFRREQKRPEGRIPSRWYGYVSIYPYMPSIDDEIYPYMPSIDDEIYPYMPSIDDEIGVCSGYVFM
jgi:hypothetical protein